MNKGVLVKLIYFNGENTFCKMVKWSENSSFHEFKDANKFYFIPKNKRRIILNWYLIDEAGSKCEIDETFSFADIKSLFSTKPIQFYVVPFYLATLLCKRCQNPISGSYFKTTECEEYICNSCSEFCTFPYNLIWMPNNKKIIYENNESNNCRQNDKIVEIIAPVAEKAVKLIETVTTNTVSTITEITNYLAAYVKKFSNGTESDREIVSKSINNFQPDLDLGNIPYDDETAKKIIDSATKTLDSTIKFSMDAVKLVAAAADSVVKSSVDIAKMTEITTGTIIHHYSSLNSTNPSGQTYVKSANKIEHVTSVLVSNYASGESEDQNNDTEYNVMYLSID